MAGFYWLAIIRFVIVFPDVVRTSTAHQIEMLERQYGRNKEGFGTTVTLSGIIAVDVSPTPHGPLLTPLPHM